MHKLQLSELAMDPRNHQRQPLPIPFVNPFVMQQLLESQANTMLWCEGFHGLPFCAGPVYGPAYHGMAHWQQHQHQYRIPSSGPSRNQHSKGFRKAEALYKYHLLHELSGTIAEDRFTGIDPGYAWTGANDNTGVGKVWRTPSRNPINI